MHSKGRVIALSVTCMYVYGHETEQFERIRKAFGLFLNKATDCISFKIALIIEHNYQQSIPAYDYSTNSSITWLADIN